MESLVVRSETTNVSKFRLLDTVQPRDDFSGNPRSSAEY